MKESQNTSHRAAPEPVAKISVSFPSDLLERIDSLAAADRRPRSQWIAIQLERLIMEDEQARHAPLEAVESSTPVPAKRRSAK